MKDPESKVIADRLLADRIILLGTPIDDQAANDCISKILYLGSSAPGEPASLYVNSPGGSITASLAILDVMKYITYPLATYCIGLAAGTAAAIVAHGRRGHRAALPTAHFGLSRTTAGENQDSTLLAKVNEAMVNALVEGTGRQAGEIAFLMEEERYFTAVEAVEFGFIDEIVVARQSK